MDSKSALYAEEHSGIEEALPKSVLLSELLQMQKDDIHHRIGEISNLESRTCNDLDSRETPGSLLDAMVVSGDENQGARRASGLGSRSVSVPKEMGLREMEEFISKLSNQNFDLKLELYQRRKRAEESELLSEKMEKLEEVNVESKKIKENLLHELEKRDQALQEAVAMIHGLEQKVKRLELAAATKTPPIVVPNLQDRNDSNTEAEFLFAPSPPSILPNIPQLLNIPRNDNLLAVSSEDPTTKADDVSTAGFETPIRQTSSLSYDDINTQAFRSLYFPGGSPSYASDARLQNPFSEDADGDEANEDNISMKSHSLSVLSESSFLSIYGKAKDPISAETEGLTHKTGTGHSTGENNTDIMSEATALSPLAAPASNGRAQFKPEIAEPELKLARTSMLSVASTNLSMESSNRSIASTTILATPLLRPAENLASSIFNTSISRTGKASNTRREKENSPLSQPQQLEISKRRTLPSSSSGVPLPQTPLSRRNAPSWLTSPDTTGSLDLMRSSSHGAGPLAHNPYLTGPHGHNPYVNAATSEAASASFRGATRNENENPMMGVRIVERGTQDETGSPLSSKTPVNGGLAGKKLRGMARSASSKIKSGFGWKKPGV